MNQRVDRMWKFMQQSIRRGHSGKKHMWEPDPRGLEDVAQEASFYSAVMGTLKVFTRKCTGTGLCSLDSGVCSKVRHRGRLEVRDSKRWK